MCYSAMLKATKSRFYLHHDIRLNLEDDYEYDCRVFPFKEFPVVTYRSGERTISEMSYSLIPSWSVTKKPKFATYNARIETISIKPTWTQPLTSKRCLVTFSSFFESCYNGTFHGQIVEFKELTNHLMTAAGIYSEWIDNGTGEIIESFAMITRGPSAQLKECGHDRSPFFIDKSGWQDWLSEDTISPEMAIDILESNKTFYEFNPKPERKLKGY